MPAEIDVYKDWLGIPEGDRPPDHYQLLRLVQFEDAPDKIRNNYKKLNSHVRKYATGQYSEKSQELLNELAKAMLCLTDAERKREYDASLGREFDDQQAVRKTVDTILIEQGAVSREQVREAAEYGERMGLDLRDAFVQLKMVEASVAAQALAQELGLPFVDLNEMVPEDEVLDRLPKNVVKQHSVLPLFNDGDVVLVACANLIDQDLEQELRLRYDAPVRTVLAAPKAIEQGIARYYAPGLRKEPSAATTTKKPGKSASAAPGAKPEKKKVPLAAGEAAEARKKNRMLALILVCWAIVGAWLVVMFVMPTRYHTLQWSVIIMGLSGLLAAAAAYATLWNKAD